MTTTVVVFKGRSNQRNVAVKDVNPITGAETDHPWTDVDRLVMQILSYTDKVEDPTAIVAVADTDVDPTLLNYSTAGQLGMVLGSLQTNDSPAAEIPAGTYVARLTQYVGATGTQVIHETTNVLKVRFVDTDTA